VSDSVTVRVPATSANLGPGFDCLGLALDLTVDVTLGLDGTAGGREHSLAPMALSAARAAYRSAGRGEPAELSVSVDGDLPVARGLGASAAARAGAIVGANAIMNGALSDEELLSLGASLEGHADNMAPALRGGMQISVRDRERFVCLEVPLADGLSVALFVPDLEMPTQESRKLLPERISREDAVANASRAALIVAALAQGRWDLLDTATEDRLHQPARAKLFPALFDVFAAAREAGAHAAYLSGGGSTVAALATSNPDAIAAAMRDTASARGFSGRTIVTRPSEQGARILA
jgi:homoserine kinase